MAMFFHGKKLKILEEDIAGPYRSMYCTTKGTRKNGKIYQLFQWLRVYSYPNTVPFPSLHI